MVSTDNLLVSAAHVGLPTVAARRGGAIDLGFTVVVSLKQIQRADKADVSGEIQLLSSEVGVGGRLLGRTSPGHPLPMVVPVGGNQVAQVVVLALAREELLALELERAGKQLEFDLPLAILVREPARFQVVTENLKPRIAASDWTELLGQQRIFQSLTITLPLSPRTTPTSNDDLRREVDRATRLYQQGLYSECVAVLRDFMDHLIKELDTSGRWETIIDRARPPDVAKELNAYATALRALVNRGHHRTLQTPGSPPLYDLTAADAEFVLESTLAFLRYLGSLART